MVEVGKNYYVIAHAYHHYLGRCVGIQGRSILLQPCFKIHSSELDWEKFLDAKTKITRANTRLHDMGEGEHELPGGHTHEFRKELPQ